METDQRGLITQEEQQEEETSYKKQKITNSRLMAKNNGPRTKSYDECGTSTSCKPKAKISSVGISMRKSGRYNARIRDPITRKEVWLGTFDTAEQASQAYLSKKSEFEKLSQQVKREKKSNNNCDQIQQPESPSVVASLPVANDQNLDIIGTHKRKMSRKYTSEIMNPITKKKIRLGTFDTVEEASRPYQSKKLEFQKLVNAKQQQQYANKQTHSKQAGKSEKLANVKQGHENQNCEFKSVGGSGINVPISNSYSGEIDQRIYSHKIGSTEEAFQAYLSKKFDSHNSKVVELQSNMSTDSSTGKEKHEGQEDDKDLWLGQWIQLPGNREVMFSLKLGLPIIDNYGSLLGEFSSLDDLSIC